MNATSPTTPWPEERNQLRQIIDAVTSTKQEVVISRSERPTVVVVDHDEYESLVETLNILSDAPTMAALEDAERDIAAGNLIDP